MKIQHIILFLLAFCLFLLCVNRDSILKEGFSYNNCRAQGYTKEFCGSQPWPSICRCPNGLIGKIMPQFGGACVCNPQPLVVYPIPMI